MLLYVLDWCLILFQILSDSLGAMSLRLDDAEAINRAVLLFLASIIGSVIPAYKLAQKDLLDLIWGK